MANTASQRIPSTSMVIELEVPKEKEAEFAAWEAEITAVASKFEGYVRTDVCPPVEGEHDKWYVVAQFDSPDSLTRWLESDVRRELYQVGRKHFSSYKIKQFKTGLEHWFINQAAQPPTWKQILATLLGLYPTVMVLILLQSSVFHWMQSLPLADSMLISNFASCILLSLVVMPFVSSLLKFWLQPGSEYSHQTDWIVVGLILAALVFMKSVFNAVI